MQTSIAGAVLMKRSSCLNPLITTQLQCACVQVDKTVIATIEDFPFKMYLCPFWPSIPLFSDNYWVRSRKNYV